MRGPENGLALLRRIVVEPISGVTRLIGVVADPVAHVKTPQALNALFARRGIDAVAVPMHVDSAGLVAFMTGLRGLRNLDGLVVTVPHKVAVADLCDTLSEDASLAGAANVVRWTADGRLAGALFDGLGFVAGLVAQGHDPRGRSVLLIGAGGAASAIAVALARAGVRRLTIANRSMDKADALAARLRAVYPAAEIAAGAADAGGHDIVVNGTSLGLKADDPLPFDVSTLRDGTVVAEVIMQPDRTALLDAAEARGCILHKGRHMLDAQLSQIADFVTAASR